MNDRISVAARMVGQWWAARLHDQHAEKREAFATAVAKRVEQSLRGEFYWSWHGREAGNGSMPRFVRTDCDYDPQGLLLEAVQEVIDPKCPGVGFSARGILPAKHELDIDTEKWLLKPKEGYGHWTAEIPVPAARCPKRPDDPSDQLNGSQHHTGKACIETGCDNPAGTAWSPFWCQPCNAKRMQRIGASLAAMATALAARGMGASEIERLRAEQAAGVMPQIGPLLDAWDGMDNDTKAAIGRAMDGTAGVQVRLVEGPPRDIGQGLDRYGEHKDKPLLPELRGENDHG